jgi:hypothetical protein
MKRNRASLTVVVVVIAVVMATVPTGALPSDLDATTASSSEQDGTPTASSSNASFGAAVSGFMQASAADAEGDVEDGMFTARFAQASAARQKALVRGRADGHAKRLDRLRAERAELLNSTDGQPTLAQRAKAARLTARINALEESINTTSVAAEQAGVDSTQLEKLRANAGNLSGREVAAIARGLGPDAKGRPDAPAGGPPMEGTNATTTNETNASDPGADSEADANS